MSRPFSFANPRFVLAAARAADFPNRPAAAFAGRSGGADNRPSPCQTPSGAETHPPPKTSLKSPADSAKPSLKSLPSGRYTLSSEITPSYFHSRNFAAIPAKCGAI